MMNWLDFTYGSFSSLAATGVFMWLFKEAMKNMLKRTVSEDLERLKHELDIKKEIIKDELQHDAYKAQLMLNSVHAIYPELTMKLEMAFGAVSGLQGVTWAKDFSQCNHTDFVNFMESKGFTKGKTERILSAIQADRKTGIEALEAELRDCDLREAREKSLEAKNYRVLKSIYCSERVLTAFDACMDDIWGAWAKINVGSMDPAVWKDGADTIRKTVPPKMNDFRRAVRDELRVERR